MTERTQAEWAAKCHHCEKRRIDHLGPCEFCTTEARNRFMPIALTPHPAPLGATDEGLREAVRAFLASWDAMAPFTTRDAPMIAALRAALQAGG